MVNLIHYSYTPNTAATNRLLNYINNVPEDISVRIFFLVPDDKFNKISPVPTNVEVVYCWQSMPKSYKLPRPVFYALAIWYVRRRIKKDDTIYAYNVPPFLKFLKKKGVKCFSEKTEFPEIDNSTSRLLRTNLKTHLSICKNLDGLFVISRNLQEYYLNKGVDPGKIHIINMTVDPKRFSNLTKAPNAPEYIAYCGNVSNSKDGVDKLIKAFSIVHQECPSIQLYIIGKKPDHNSINNNLDIVNELGLSKHIVFTGEIPSSEIPSLLYNARALLLCRPDNQQAKYGFPTKLGEYLMTERPVVLTSVGDIPEFLENHKSALLSDPNKDIDFAKNIIWVLRNEDDATNIGLNGKAVALKYFNAQIEAQKLFYIMTQNGCK